MAELIGGKRCPVWEGRIESVIGSENFNGY